jgi:hypothetical protein
MGGSVWMGIGFGLVGLGRQTVLLEMARIRMRSYLLLVVDG